MLSDAGAPLARATRSWLSKPISMAERARRLVFGWPLVLLGLVDDTKHLDMVLLPGEEGWWAVEESSWFLHQLQLAVYSKQMEQPAVAC